MFGPPMKVLLVELQFVASSFLKRKELLPEEVSRHSMRDCLRGLALVPLAVLRTAEAAVAASEKGLVGESH